jgi:SAM-dependent MidA family methyltransferase
VPDLLTHLRDLQTHHQGAIPVEDYVREALYHPTFGYYSKNIRTVGRRGDFSTTVTLGDALARALARWLAIPRPTGRAPWHVIEAGPGTGELAAAILRHLGFWTRRAVTYHLVESSPVLRSEQTNRLRHHRNVRWHDSMTAALTACEGRATIFSNELIDAFPPRLYERRADRWHEVAVQINDGKITEFLLPDRPIPQTSIFDHPHPEGQRVEVHATAAEWLHTWTPAFREGRILTIDYGDTAKRIVHRRPRGTLRAYCHHQRFEGLAIYHRFGKQDITADVNFTDLETWGKKLGLETETLTDQTHFLTQHGSQEKNTPHDAALADHAGAGTAFKVLIQKRSPNHPPTPTLPELLCL